MQGKVPLGYAIDSNLTEIVKLLLDKGADVNVKLGPWEWTPLHWAAKRGYTDIAELMLTKGADINAKNKYKWLFYEYGHTPLYYAIRKGHYETAAFLRRHGGIE